MSPALRLPLARDHISQVSHMKEIEKEHVLVLGLGSWEKFIVRVKSFELGYSRTNEQPSPLSEN